MASRFATDAQPALERIQEQIVHADDEGRHRDADRLREIYAFLVNLLEAFAT